METEKKKLNISNLKLIEYKKQQIILLVKSAKLNFLERGKIYNDFLQETGLSGRALGKELKIDHRDINRNIRQYKTYSGLSEENKTKINDFPDREQMRILDKPLKKETDINIYFEAYSLFRPLGFSVLTSVLNGNTSIETMIERQKKKHQEFLNTAIEFSKWVKDKTPLLSNEDEEDEEDDDLGFFDD
jgi:hypothetical protein